MESPEQVFERRRLAVQKTMAAKGLSALVLYGVTSYAGHAALGHGYIRYLTDWTCRFHPSVLVMPAEGLPTLLIPGGHELLYADEIKMPWAKWLLESPGNYGKLARQIAEEGGGAIGLIGQGDFPLAFYRSLVEGGNDRGFRDASAILDDMRNTKDDFELDRHRRAARISDMMFERLVEVLPGYSGPAAQLMAEMEFAGRTAGAEYATVWLVSGQPADRPRYRLEENERKVRRGDQILAGTYVTYRGYWGHSIRMGSIGKPSEAYQRIYDATLEQHREAAALIRVGENAHKVQERADEVADKLMPRGRHPVDSRKGHLMGLDYAEKQNAAAFPQPDTWSRFPVNPPAGMKLVPGMVLETHTMLGEDGVGFGFIGDVYLAKESGAERLTQFPQDLFVI